MKVKKKQAGIWMDNYKAIIVSNHDGHEVGEFQPKSTVMNEYQKTGNDQASESAKANYIQKFFKSIAAELTNTQELFIIGPALAQEQFRTYLLGTPQYKSLDIALDTAQKLNESDVLEVVKQHFDKVPA